ncbi:OmpP1/FadL family transporter [Marinomonas colpomeniae]|uniref:Outer membrane protein transport protein n=1 Tax=Marinomonas colpomeniae TaxID=2774408 RepID=A0ABR8P0J8_9GAMM|nr:outer membrane protein transport protein [Marinomonas colpomeniae]MBD5771814.1 outer membrane protein transport protein [Marinomonas colpomeniae]
MKTSSQNLFKASVIAASVAVASSTYSAGFALNDHSATASGNALAGAAASGADISFSYWNPALFLNASETTVYASGAYVMPSVEATVTSASGASALGSTNIGADSSSDSVSDALIPAIYFAKPLSSNTVAGISLNVPFGLSGDYGDDWAGRFHGTETGIQDIALSFTLAHQMNKQLSIGASVQLHEAEVILASAVGAPGLEGDGIIEADATGYGYSLGALFEPMQGTRIGVGYRSKVDFDFEGDITYTDVDSLNSTLTSYGLANLVDTSVSDSLTFPSVLTISLDQELTKKLVLGLTAMRTGWDSMDGINIDFDSSQDNSVLSFGFENKWFYSIGLTYDYSDKLTLRTGVAMDDSPVKDEYSSARTPDGDRKWISVGGTYDFNDMSSVAFAFTHVMIDDVNVSRDGTGEDASRGTLEADYESKANVFSVAMNMAF